MSSADIDAKLARSKGPEKLKVFISYSRHDLEFVDRLQHALVERGIRAYVDREDIAKGEAWWSRIQQLITEADTIIFILSPNSAASPVCQQEVDFAASLNKRFIPIVAEDLADAQVPETLSRLNYVFFIPNPPAGASGDFSEAVDQLANALDTDIAWIRSHTRYGERSAEWERAGRTTSHLIRGRNIDDAEAWRDKRPERAPGITDAQLAYIAESRKAATGRQRWWIGGSLIIAAITTGLAIYALTQQQAAVASQQRTVRVLASTDFQQGTRAIEDPETTPQGLALLARSVRNGNDERALTRLWTALQQRSFWLPSLLEKIPPQPPRPEGYPGLVAHTPRGAAPKVPDDIAQRFKTHVIDGVEFESNFIAVSGDGSRILTVIGNVVLDATEVKARVWNSDGRPITKWFAPDYKGDTYISVLRGQFSHDGRFLALEVTGWREPSFLEIWDLKKGTRYEATIKVTGLRPQFQNSTFTQIAFLEAPQSDKFTLATLLTASLNGDAQVHYIQEDSILSAGRTRHRELITYVAVDPRGEWLLSGGDDGTVHVSSSSRPDEPVGVPIKLSTRIARIMRDGANGLVADTAGGERHRFDLMQPLKVRLPEDLELPATAPYCIEWPEGNASVAKAEVAKLAPASGPRLAYMGTRKFEVVANGKTSVSPTLDVDLELVCLDQNNARVSLTTEDFVTRIWDTGLTAMAGQPLDEKRYFQSRPTPESTKSVVLTANGDRALVRSFFWDPPNVAYWWFNLWDSGTALPLFDRKQSIDWSDKPVPENALLDSSERFVLFAHGTKRDRASILEYIQIKPPEGIAAWLPDFAEAIAGQTFDDQGLPINIPAPERTRRLTTGVDQIEKFAVQNSE